MELRPANGLCTDACDHSFDCRREVLLGATGCRIPAAVLAAAVTGEHSLALTGLAIRCRLDRGRDGS